MKLKKLAIMLGVMLVGVQVYASYEHGNFKVGEGSDSSPYVIVTVEDIKDTQNHSDSIFEWIDYSFDYKDKNLGTIEDWTTISTPQSINVDNNLKIVVVDILKDAKDDRVLRLSSNYKNLVGTVQITEITTGEIVYNGPPRREYFVPLNSDSVSLDMVVLSNNGTVLSRSNKITLTDYLDKETFINYLNLFNDSYNKLN